MNAYLILADGQVFKGKQIGAIGEVIGELVFTTSMVGYMETITDPSYYGQIVLQTFPIIGNYGQIQADAESEKPALKGYVVRELCSTGSNFRKEAELDDYLKRFNIVGISNVDTREITRKIRDYGVINAMITDNLKQLEDKIKAVKGFKVINAVRDTCIIEPFISNKGGEYKVVLLDFGAKANIERELINRDCEVIKVPGFLTAKEIMSYNPDGIMLSNGGGDPSENIEIIEQLKIINKYKIPIFGICLGHQLLALSMGAKTKKLKYGHRGTNQPVKDLKTGRVYITSQNHGYAVVPGSLDAEVGEVFMVNANDKTCEGIIYKEIPAFTVQFHPEACGGPHDTEFLFDRFIDLMRGNKQNA